MKELKRLGIPEVLWPDLRRVAQERDYKVAWLSTDECVIVYGCPHSQRTRDQMIPEREKADALASYVGFTITWDEHLWRGGLLWLGTVPHPFSVGTVLDEGERRAPLIAKLSELKKDRP